MKKGVIAAVIVVLCLCTGGATAFLTVSALGTGARIERVSESLAEAEARRDSLKQECEARQNEANGLNSDLQSMEDGEAEDDKTEDGQTEDGKAEDAAEEKSDEENPQEEESQGQQNL